MTHKIKLFIILSFFFLLPFIKVSAQTGTVNVKDFGAIGNGATDDIAAIRSASLAAGHNGKIIFPSGYIFAISDSIRSEFSGQVFDGYGATIKMLNHSRMGIVIRHDSCRILGLSWEGDKVGNTGSLQGSIIFLQGASYTTVRDNVVKYPSANGIAILSGNSYKNGVRAISESNNNLFENNTIIGLKDYTSNSTDYAGILIGYSDLTGCNSNKFINNTVEGNNSLQVGIGLIGSGKENLFSGNLIRKVRQYGIILYETALQPDYAVSNNIIVENIIDSVGSSATIKGMGIYLQQAHGTSVFGNHISNVEIGAIDGGLAQGGISLDGAFWCNISNNTINKITSRYPAIHANNAFHTIISNNLIRETFQGIKIQLSSFLNASHNQITDVRNSGIILNINNTSNTISSGFTDIPTGYSIKLTHNTITSKGGATGINWIGNTVSPSRNCEISNNIIITDGSGIQANHLHSSRIEKNDIMGNGVGNGIELAATNDSLLIAYNSIRHNSGNFSYGIYSLGKANSLIANKIYNSKIPQISHSENFNGVYNSSTSLITGSVIGSGLGFGCTTCAGNAYLKLYDPGTGYSTLQSGVEYGLSINPSGGKVALGLSSASALLHFKAGAASEHSAPIKFSKGTKLMIPEAGALEYDTIGLWLTNASLERGRLISEVLTTKSYASTVAINFNESRLQTLSLTGDVIFTTLNLRAGSEIILRVVADGVDRKFSIPEQWTIVGSESITGLKAGHTGILIIRSFGESNADVIVEWKEQQIAEVS